MHQLCAESSGNTGAKPLYASVMHMLSRANDLHQTGPRTKICVIFDVVRDEQRVSWTLLITLEKLYESLILSSSRV